MVVGEASCHRSPGWPIHSSDPGGCDAESPREAARDSQPKGGIGSGGEGLRAPDEGVAPAPVERRWILPANRWPNQLSGLRCLLVEAWRAGLCNRYVDGRTELLSRSPTWLS